MTPEEEAKFKRREEISRIVEMIGKECMEIKGYNWFNTLYLKFLTVSELSFDSGERIGRDEVLEELDSQNVGCVGMSRDFIAGSNWCNGLWKDKIKKAMKKDSKP